MKGIYVVCEKTLSLALMAFLPKDVASRTSCRHRETSKGTSHSEYLTIRAIVSRNPFEHRIGVASTLYTLYCRCIERVIKFRSERMENLFAEPEV